jgi:hypothetical protein
VLDPLESLTVAELRVMAKDLDIPKNRSRRQLMEAIRASVVAA